MKKKKSKAAADRQPYIVSTKMQQLFIAVIIGGYIVNDAYLLMTAFPGGESSADLLANVGYYASYILLPLALLVIAYFLDPRRLTRQAKLFEATLISTAAYTIWTTLSSLLSYALFSTELTNFEVYHYTSTIAYVLAYAVILLYVRRRRMWA